MPSRVSPMPVSPARGIEPSSSVLGSTSSALTGSGERVPSRRAAGFWPALVPKPSTRCAVAGVSLEPRTPSGSSSSTRIGAAARARCWAFVLARSLPFAARYLSQPDRSAAAGSGSSARYGLAPAGLALGVLLFAVDLGATWKPFASAFLVSTSGFARADAPPGASVTAASKQAATIAMVRRMVLPLRSGVAPAAPARATLPTMDTNR
jgi:hypothetical protein